ncbi:MAG: glycosyltransferase family 4 protein [Patescibacteria group bacterium]|nr:glycosyltransferase family 4 protein [Patescibacteria group bacterium]
MKILIITEFFPKSEKGELRGGVEARAFYMAKYLAEKYETHIICSREPHTSEEDNINNIKIHRCGPIRNYTQGGSITKRLSFIYQTIKKARNIKPDLVDGYNWICYLATLKIAKKLNIPSIATYHDVWIGDWIKNMGLISGILGSIMEKYILSKKWSLFIANSKVTKNKLIKQNIKADKISVVYNGVDFKKFNNINTQKDVEPTICYIGRLVKYKKVDILIKALKKIKNNLPQIKLKIIGSGPEINKIKTLAKNLDLENNITFLGFIKNHEKVIAHLKKSHVFCLPSIVEGFGMVAVEAMAAGIPYVCTNIPPIREATKNGKGGLLFEKNNINDLKNKLLKILLDNQLYQSLANEGPVYTKRYDWSKIGQELEKTYYNLV